MMLQALGLFAFTTVALCQSYAYTGTISLTQDEFCHFNNISHSQCDKQFDSYLSKNPYLKKCSASSPTYSNRCPSNDEFGTTSTTTNNDVLSSNAVEEATESITLPDIQNHAGDEDIEIPPATDVSYSRKIMDFSLRLFQTAFPKGSPDNYILSPVMVQTLLSYLNDGASQATRQEMKTILQLSTNDLKEIRSVFQPKSEEQPKYKLDVASQIFKSPLIELLPGFQDSLNRNKVPMQEMDFTNPRIAANEINHWVNITTREKITSIIDERSLDPATQLMLLNAIYFNGTWLYSFNNTVRDTFHLGGNKQHPCNMMTLSQKLRYGYTGPNEDDQKLLWVELPYNGDEMSMILLLPARRFKLDEELLNFKVSDLENILAEIERNNKGKIKVKLPVFKAESEVSLVKPLQQMGLRSVFGDGKPFAKLSNTNVKISNVKQKSFLSVNERGTTATSVTVATIIPLSLPRNVEFIANQPFASIIIDKKSKIPLFIARISKPERLK
ncbi:leukocyte elastase inhibitor-like [Anopheles aquasalis]|uniref:leukocyte elastase inhibitor-like n=1 Tax=Anopheles aquasalis TaxID=42839 RepID=UPI00215A752C|nr:leukocyte elastase inhibitor-like [Anopheles aquasalis]